MKKNKKGSFKNRIKRFYREPGEYSNRIKDQENLSSPQDNDADQEDAPDLENPEQEDLS